MSSKKGFRNILKWIGRILLGLLILLVVLIVIGLIREAIVRKNYHTQYPAPGKMVTVNDHEIHINCVGEGSPTIVLEADLDQYGSLSWDSIQDEIGKYTRVCSYDRAGIMWSEPGPRPRDGETIATELKTLLEIAGEEGPYILVGHAFGGAYVRIFAGQNPDDVCGMVLLDSSHPDMITRFSEYFEPEIPDKNIRPLILLLSNLGSPGRFKGNIYDLPTDDIYNPIQAYLPESSMAWFDETVEANNTLAQAGQYEYLGDFPLIVIASSKPSQMVNGQDINVVWLALQEELLLLSNNSEIRIYLVGHYPQLQSPDLVIEAILDVRERCEKSLE